MLKKNFLFAFFLIGALAVGCTDNATDSTNQTSQFIMPLKVGNTWDYKVFETDTTGVKIDGETFTTTVVEDTTLNGETWFVMDGFLSKNQPNALQNKSNGLWTHKSLVPGLLFKYLGQVNDTYSLGNDTLTITSISEKVDVAGKSYTCYHYQHASSVSSGFDFFVAPGVGVVKFIRTRNYPSGKTRITSTELQSYSLK